MDELALQTQLQGIVVSVAVIGSKFQKGVLACAIHSLWLQCSGWRKGKVMTGVDRR